MSTARPLPPQLASALQILTRHPRQLLTLSLTNVLRQLPTPQHLANHHQPFVPLHRALAPRNLHLARHYRPHCAARLTLFAADLIFILATLLCLARLV